MAGTGLESSGSPCWALNLGRRGFTHYKAVVVEGVGDGRIRRYGESPQGCRLKELSPKS